MSITRPELSLYSYEKIYEWYFKNHCELAPYGVLCKDTVMRTLADYAILKENAERVYFAVTGGLVQAANAYPDVVIKLAEKRIESRILELLELLEVKCTCGAVTTCV